MSDQITRLRRTPVQQRSAKRVDRMLDACAELIDEVGYEAMSTRMIAERAEVAIGSLYQFFPDKRAVVQAMTQRNLEHFMRATEQRLAEANPQTWWQTVDTMLELYLQMHRELPGFNRIHFGDIVDHRLLDDTKSNNTLVAEGITGALVARFDLAASDIAVPIAVAVEAADSVLKLAFARDSAGDQQVVDELKSMIKLYLSSRFRR